MTPKFLEVVIILVISILAVVVKSQVESSKPVFLSPEPFQFNVSELQSTGYTVGKIDATRSSFVLPCFTLKTESTMFRMPECTLPDNENIYLIHKLDYERQKSYVLEVVATDFFDSKLVTTKNLTINVTNANDEQPVFKNKGFDLKPILEDTKVAAQLPDLISVTDLDGEVNPKNLTVRCDTSFQSSCVYFDVIQSNTPNKKDWKGHFFLKRTISLQEYKIKLDATDGEHISSLVFTLPVKGINNHPPQFTDVASTIVINEDTAVGTDISPVFVITDEDGNEGYLDVSCNSNSGNVLIREACNTFEIKKLSGSTNFKWFGMVALKKKLDFETSIKVFVFQLLATDGKNDNKFNISIILEDSNDEPPYFLPNSREWKIAENAKIGSLLEGALEVSDKDITPGFSNVTVTCVTTNGHEYEESCNTFVLSRLEKSNKTNSWSTRLILNKTLDYESRKHYIIRFKATDGKSYSYLERKIYVTDVNDNPPSFTYPMYNATLAMSTPENTPFEPYIVASDVDMHNILLTVSCVSSEDNETLSNNTCTLFGVKTIRANATHWVGQLVLLKSVNYDELQPKYYVNLIALDGSYNSTQTTVVVTILPIPTHLSYWLPNPASDQNITIKCDFAFSSQLKESTIEILRANITVLSYSPETNTSTLPSQNESSKLMNVRYTRMGRHGYIEFTINTRSCRSNHITCRSRDGKGKFYSVSQDVFPHKFTPSVSISRGSCDNLKRNNTRLECVGKNKDTKAHLKWYLSSDNENYKELVGADQTDSEPKFDYFNCYYTLSSAIIFNYQGKRQNVKCVMISTIDNKDVQVSEDVFNVGFKVPPKSLRITKKDCSAVDNDTVKFVCGGYVGYPPSNIQIFVLNKAYVRLYEISKKHYKVNNPKYVSSLCQYYNSIEYTHTINKRSTTRIICKTRTLIDDKLHETHDIFDIEPSDFCHKSQANRKVVHSAFLSVLMFCITFVIAFYM